MLILRFTISFIVLPWILVGQISLSQQVFGSGGSASSGESGTMGEVFIFGQKEDWFVCQGFQTGFYPITTSLNEEESDNLKIKIFPNPTTSILHLEGELHSVEQVSIIDILGKEIKSFNLEVGQKFVEIELSGNPPGIYGLSITSHYQNRKLIGWFTLQ